MSYVESARRTEGFIGINGINVWGSIKEFVTDIEYIDVATGETDSFDITVIDSAGHFINDWLIDKGTELESKIKLLNWKEPGDVIWVDCGSFLCDSLKVNGPPTQVTIQSLALPLNGAKNSRKWEDVFVSAIAQDICGRLGCELEYYADDIVIKSRQQSRQKDIEFLFNLCKEYGFGMKVYRHKIVIFNREQQDAAAAVKTINISSAEEYSLDDNEEGTYTGAECTYKPDGSDDELTYTYGSNERLLKIDTSATSAQEAELKAKAALYDANAEAVKLRFSILGGLEPIYAGSNYNIESLGAYSGKYAIDKVTHTLTGAKAYRMSVEAHGVELRKDNLIYGSTETEVSLTITGIEAGRAIELNDAPLYISSEASAAVRRISGTYYLYDGKNFNGRYRICNQNEVGATPANANVTGYIDGEYI